MNALADQIGTAIGTAVPNLQTVGFMEVYPTVPSVDVYPADEAGTPYAMRGKRDLYLTVRARTSTAASEEGQQTLVKLMGDGSESVARAIRSDKTIGGRASSLAIEANTGFQLMLDAGGDGAYVGATWTVHIVP